MKRVTAVIGLFGCLLLVAGTGHAYKEKTVTNGGTLTGSVTLDGVVPKPKGYNLVTFPDPIYCGRISDGRGFRLLQPFRVGPAKAFQEVVILIEDIEEGKPFDFPTPRVESVDCKFEPFITVVRNRADVEIVNLDPVLHDIQAYETSERGARVLFNVPLPMNERFNKQALMTSGRVKHLPGRVMKQKVRVGKGRNVFVMQCGFHAYMESWGLAVEHPYFAKTANDGRFSIENIPPGTYSVLLWHPILQKRYTVTIPANGTATLNVEFDAPKGRLYATEAMDNPRFGMDILDTEIVPSVELQKY